MTVLFTDLVGSTELASALDPEDWREILGAYHRLVATAVADHRGFVSQFQGDGALAFFGYPETVETSGPDAVAAGLAVIRATAELTSSLPSAPFAELFADLGVGRLAARAGVHTGVVVVAPNQLSGAHTIDVFGQVPNLAARLQAAGAPGEVLLTAATRSLTQGLFELEALRPLRLKGLSRPVRAWRVLGPSGARSRLEGSPLVQFVARRDELAWLDEQWQTAQQGPTKCVLVTGEAGIGKSRLMLEFARRLQHEGNRVATAYCNRADALSPLQPFGTLMGSVPDDPEAAVRWVAAMAADGPTMLVIDDAHWADPSTLEVADRLAQRELPILIAITSRPHSLKLTRVGFSASTRLTLDRLAPVDARSIVALVPGGTNLRPEVVDALVERADGVPLYAEELTRSVVERGLIDPTSIPETLAEVVTARLDRLGDAKAVAQLAAVIGREFDAGLLAQTSGLEAEQVSAHLRILVEQAVVEAPHSSEGPLWFRHALIHEAAYYSLLRSARRRAHSRVADALIDHQRPTGAPQVVAPQVVAHHLGEAGRWEEAAEMWRQASRLARRNSRFKEAVGHERRLIQLLPDLPPARRDTIELHARRRLAICLTTVDQATSEAISEAERALELGTRLGDDVAVLEIYLVLIPWWQAQADYASISNALPRAVRLAEKIDDPWFISVLTLMPAAMDMWLGRIPAAVDALSAAWSRAGAPIDQSLWSFGPASPLQVLVLASVRMASALASWLSGDSVQAWKLADDTLEFAAASRMPPAQAVASAAAALLAQLDGDAERTIEFSRIAQEVPDEVATLQWRRWAAVLRWWAGDQVDVPSLPGPMLRPYFQMLVAGSGRMPVEESIGLLDQALATAHDTGERFCEAEILRTRARVWAETGHIDNAAADLAAALVVARSQGARSFELRALNDQASLLGNRGALAQLSLLLDAIGSTGPRRDVELARRLLGSDM